MGAQPSTIDQYCILLDQGHETLIVVLGDRIDIDTKHIT